MSDSLALPRVVLVTGTSTEVGKTVVTAALAAVILARGSSVAVVKPAQTGVRPGEPGDIEEVRRLLGAGRQAPDGQTPDVEDGARCTDPRPEAPECARPGGCHSAPQHPRAPAAGRAARAPDRGPPSRPDDPLGRRACTLGR